MTTTKDTAKPKRCMSCGRLLADHSSADHGNGEDLICLATAEELQEELNQYRSFLKRDPIENKPKDEIQTELARLAVPFALGHEKLGTMVEYMAYYLQQEIDKATSEKLRAAEERIARLLKSADAITLLYDAAHEGGAGVPMADGGLTVIAPDDCRFLVEILKEEIAHREVQAKKEQDGVAGEFHVHRLDHSRRLAEILAGAPDTPKCTRCGRKMIAALVWTCPRCDAAPGAWDFEHWKRDHLDAFSYPAGSEPTVLAAAEDAWVDGKEAGSKAARLFTGEAATWIGNKLRELASKVQYARATEIMVPVEILKKAMGRS